MEDRVRIGALENHGLLLPERHASNGYREFEGQGGDCLDREQGAGEFPFA